MRALSRSLLIFAAVSLFAAEEIPPPPPPQLPENLTLTNKKVLRKISVVRWEKERVVIRHLGGADPIMYKYIAEPQRATMLALRDIEMGKPPPPRPGSGQEQNTGAAAPAGMIKYTGHCLVATPGTLETNKVTGARVLVLPPEAEERFRLMSLKITLPRPYLELTTDQDGKFEFTAPEKQNFFLVVQGSRRVDGQTQYYHWRMKSADIKDPAQILLGADNSTSENKKLTFDK